MRVLTWEQSELWTTLTTLYKVQYTAKLSQSFFWGSHSIPSHEKGRLYTLYADVQSSQWSNTIKSLSQQVKPSLDLSKPKGEDGGSGWGLHAAPTVFFLQLLRWLVPIYYIDIRIYNYLYIYTYIHIYIYLWQVKWRQASSRRVDLSDLISHFMVL